jgi:hypothetical protein
MQWPRFKTIHNIAERRKRWKTPNAMEPSINSFWKNSVNHAELDASQEAAAPLEKRYSIYNPSPKVQCCHQGQILRT